MTNQIDVNQLSNALQQKVDLPDGKNQGDLDFVVEFQAPDPSNGYKWYRLYKSGWIEQGGTASGVTGGNKTYVTLPKQMADTNYFVTSSIKANTDYFVGDDGTTSAYIVSNSQIWLSFSASSSALYVNYVVRGMAAS